MNFIVSPLQLVLRLPSHQFFPHYQIQPLCISGSSIKHYDHCIPSLLLSFPSRSDYSLRFRKSPKAAAELSEEEEGPVAVINFEDVMEKDWSFLDQDDLRDTEEHNQKIGRIVSAGGIEESSRVLVSIGSEGFVDQLVETAPCSLLLLVHDSLFILAILKEKYDKVKCWQGELIHVPEKWAPLDVVFLYFLPAMPFQLDQIFETLAKRCSPGARVVISHPQGREILEQQRKQYQDVIVSDLPDKMTLQNVAADHSFEMVEFEDEAGFYLAVLKFSGSGK